jgi:putative hemolysin
VKRLILMLCAAGALAGCAFAPSPAEVPSAPPAAPAGVPPPEAERQGEAQALEQAESKCASGGQHAVARRVDGTTVYDCVSPSDNGNNGQPAPRP